VLAVVQRTLDHILETVAAGTTVELRNFGVFEVKVRKARIGRNPKRPETDVLIPGAPWSSSSLARKCGKR
jgi:nucleoid DNA-binding protein